MTDEDVQSWIEYSDKDLASARAVFQAGVWETVYFHCQQAIEKRIKALIVKRLREFPPKVHKLLELAEIVGLELNPEQEEFFGNLSDLYLATRYPEIEFADPEVETGKAAKETLSRTEEAVEWLDQLLKQRS